MRNYFKVSAHTHTPTRYDGDRPADRYFFFESWDSFDMWRALELARRFMAAHEKDGWWRLSVWQPLLTIPGIPRVGVATHDES